MQKEKQTWKEMRKHFSAKWPRCVSSVKEILNLNEVFKNYRKFF